MITLELTEVEIDHCIECGGIWLDAGELELLLGEPGKSKQLLDSFKIASNYTEKPRRCPICDKKMQKIIVDETSALLMDKCTKGDGLWFDKGELGDIIDKTHLDKDNKIQRLLTDMFGREQKHQ